MMTIRREICKRIKTASGEGFAMFSTVSFVIAIALSFELENQQIHFYKISWVAWKIVWQD